MRVIIVSGASSGIGHATAERFARGGDIVINFDVKAPKQTSSPGVSWNQVDVSNWSAVEKAVASVVANHGRLDVVVANAGISMRRAAMEIVESDARRIVEVNLLGVLALWRCAAQHMTKSTGGVLLATSSVNGMRGYPLYADYNATKAGVMALCNTLALELSPKVRVACVSPGAVLTPMQQLEYTPAMLDEVSARIPMGRHASTAEIAEAFYFLASPGAAFITGQQLVVDGGETTGATTLMPMQRQGTVSGVA